MPRLKCPRCATVVEVAPGAAPQCPACGFGSGTNPATAPPAPTPALAPSPTPAYASAPAPAPAAAFPPPASNPWNANTAPPAPMHRPGWVTFVGVYWFIAGSLALLAGFFLILAGTVLAAVFEDGVGEFGDLVGGFLAVIGVLVLAFGALAIVLGVFVMKGRNWARVTSLVLAILGLVFGVLGLVSSLALGNADASPGGGLLGIVLDILIVVALTRPESKAFFGVGAPPAGPV